MADQVTKALWTQNAFLKNKKKHKQTTRHCLLCPLFRQTFVRLEKGLMAVRGHPLGPGAQPDLQFASSMTFCSKMFGSGWVTHWSMYEFPTCLKPQGWAPGGSFVAAQHATKREPAAATGLHLGNDIFASSHSISFPPPQGPNKKRD